MAIRHTVTAAILCILSLPAAAQDARRLCTDRPGIGSPTCTLSPGRVLVEASILDRSRESDGISRTDTLIAADTLLRAGVGERVEVQFGWAAFGRTDTRDRAAGVRERASGIGDLLVSLRRNLASPDGSGRSAAIQPYVTLPIGGSALGAGDWAAGVIVPLGWEVSDRIGLDLTPRVDAAVDADGSGRHLSTGAVFGIDIALAERLNTAIELGATHDDDPAGRTTPLVAALALALQIGEDAEVDLGGVAGLNADAADFRLYAGFARRF